MPSQELRIGCSIRGLVASPLVVYEPVEVVSSAAVVEREP
jgi:hypothetical protein